MSESQVLKQARDTHSVIGKAHNQLYVGSEEMRRELERITNPLLQWVHDAHHLLGQHERTNPECRALHQRLMEIGGLIVDGDDVQINYNVEREMDRRVREALVPAEAAVRGLIVAVQADPLVTADTDSSTAPMVDLLRQMAEGLGAR